MSFLIVHGNNLVASRNLLSQQKIAAGKKGWEIITLEGKKVELPELKQSLESGSLFAVNRLVIIENLFSSTISKRKEDLLDYLKLTDLKAELVIWEGKQIDGRALKSFANKAKIQNLSLPAVIFKFLDSFWPANNKITLSFWEESLRTEPVELVFYLLARRLHDLIVTKDLGKIGLSGFAPWQQGKLFYQANKFTLEKLLEFYQRLLEIDWRQKSGQAALPLKSTLELLILDL